MNSSESQKKPIGVNDRIHQLSILLDKNNRRGPGFSQPYISLVVNQEKRKTGDPYIQPWIFDTYRNIKDYGPCFDLLCAISSNERIRLFGVDPLEDMKRQANAIKKSLRI